MGLRAEGLAFCAVVTLLTVLGFGTFPALTAAKVDLNEALIDGGGRLAGGARGKRLRNGLIVAEVATGVVLLIGATLVLRSFVKLAAVDLGFEPRNVLTVQLRPQGAAYAEPEARRAFFRQLVDRLESQAGVVAASAVLIRPLEGEVGWDATYRAEGQSKDEAGHNAVANFEVVSPHYFRGVFGIALVAGREFTGDDRLGKPGVVILNRSLAARLFGSAEDAVEGAWPSTPPARTGARWWAWPRTCATGSCRASGPTSTSPWSRASAPSSTTSPCARRASPSTPGHAAPRAPCPRSAAGREQRRHRWTRSWLLIARGHGSARCS